MTTLTSPFATAAAGALRDISERERGERAQRAAAGALVLRAVEHVVGGDADEFLLRRAAREAAGLDAGAERAILLRILHVLEAGCGEPRLAAALVSYACQLESTRRLPEANAAISLAVALDA